MVVHDPLYIKKLRINAGLEPPLILKPPQVLYLVEGTISIVSGIERGLIF